MYCCLFLSLRNLASHYILWTSKEIVSLEKFFRCFEVFFLLGILLRTLHMVVLEESSLELGFSKKILADCKVSLGLTEWFLFVWFCIFYLPNILQKVLEFFSHWISHLILPQFFSSFNCLCSPGVTSLANF